MNNHPKRVLMIVLAAVCAAELMIAPATFAAEGSSKALTQSAKRAAELKAREDQARERCRSNRGVDCDSPEGLKEWVLQERTRAEAIRDGSRIRSRGNR